MNLAPTEWLLLASIIYSGIVTGCLFGAWLKWWPAVQRDADRRSRKISISEFVRMQVEQDRIRAKFDRESA